MSQYKDFIGKFVLPHQLHVGKIVYEADIYLQTVQRHKIVSKLITTDNVYSLPRYDTLLSICNGWYEDLILLGYVQNTRDESIKRIFHTKKAAQQYIEFSKTDPKCEQLVQEIEKEYAMYDDYLPDPTDWLGSE